MITKLDKISDISTEFGTTLASAKQMSWFYNNKNPNSPVQPVMGSGKITDWIGYDHTHNLIVAKLLSRYNKDGKVLNSWTGNCGCRLIDNETDKILGFTGDENIPVEKGVNKYILHPYDISGQNGNPRLYADQVFSGDIRRNGLNIYQFTTSNNVVITNFFPKQIEVKDVNNKLDRTELIVTVNGNGSYPNQYKFTNNAYVCSREDLSKAFTFTVRFYYKTNNITQIRNISDTGYTEILDTVDYSGYRQGSNWKFLQNTILEVS